MVREYKENELYCCDNLDLLRKIPNNSINLIYCDILYGTGKSFADYKDIKSDEKTVRDFYSPRLNLMRDKLKEDGSIYIQTDQHINYLIRMIMNEIFGEENFRNEIIWWKKTFSQNEEDLYLKKHDNILFYTKSGKCYFNPQQVFNEKKAERISKGYYNAGDTYLVYDEEKFEAFKEKQKIKGKYKEKKITFRLGEEAVTMCHDVIDDISIVNPNSKEVVKYSTQKPVELMERIILSSSKEGDVVADFFMGSGSFIIGAAKLKRKYIGCDINPRAMQICRDRLKDV